MTMQQIKSFLYDVDLSKDSVFKQALLQIH